MLFRLILIATLAAPFEVAAQSSWTVTGAQGGSADGGGSCSRSDGTSTCTRHGTVSGPNGNTRSYDKTRLATQDGVTTTRNGLRGGTLTRTRTR